MTMTANRPTLPPRVRGGEGGRQETGKEIGNGKDGKGNEVRNEGNRDEK